MTNTYNVIYTGSILSGFDKEISKSRATQLLKLSSEKADAFFSGNPITLKKNLELENALKIQKMLKEIGLDIQLIEAIEKPMFELVKDEPETSTTSTRNHMQAQNIQPKPIAEESNEKPMFELVKDEPETSTTSTRNYIQTQAQARTRDNMRVQASSVTPKSTLQRNTNKILEDENDMDDVNQPSVAMVPPFLGSSFDGRYGRLNFVNAISLFFVSLIGLFIALAYLPFTLSIFFLAPAYYFFRHLSLRCHDLNLPAYTSLLILIPYINLLFILVLLVIPGKKASNNYGPPSEQGPIWGLIGLGITGIGFIYIYVTLVSAIADITRSVEEYEKNKIPAEEIELVAKPFMVYLINGQYEDALSLTSQKFQSINLSSTLEANFDGFKYTNNIAKLKLNETGTEYEYFYPLEDEEKFRYGGALMVLDGTSKDYQPIQAYISLLLIQENGSTKVHEINFDEASSYDDDNDSDDYSDNDTDY